MENKLGSKFNEDTCVTFFNEVVKLGKKPANNILKLRDSETV